MKLSAGCLCLIVPIRVACVDVSPEALVVNTWPFARRARASLIDLKIQRLASIRSRESAQNWHCIETHACMYG